MAVRIGTGLSTQRDLRCAAAGGRRGRTRRAGRMQVRPRRPLCIRASSRGTGGDIDLRARRASAAPARGLRRCGRHRTGPRDPRRDGGRRLGGGARTRNGVDAPLGGRSRRAPGDVRGSRPRGRRRGVAARRSVHVRYGRRARAVVGKTSPCAGPRRTSLGSPRERPHTALPRRAGDRVGRAWAYGSTASR